MFEPPLMPPQRKEAVWDNKPGISVSDPETISSRGIEADSRDYSDSLREKNGT
jgi:hypothetical protein